MKSKARATGNGMHGMNWLRPEKRLAIYLRDGLACCYCGASVETETKLTLDHLTPRSRGGSNQATNLVTACVRCNSSRGTRSWRAFAGAVATYINHGVTAAEITTHIAARRKSPISVDEARALIARRGGFTAALRTPGGLGR